MTQRIRQLPQVQVNDVFEENNRQIFTTLNCTQIGTIQSFDATNQTAVIKIALKKVISENLDGTRILGEYPLLLDCPVFFLFGGVSFLSMPIQAGDTCLVLFNDREIDQWFANGGTASPVTYRAHDISDAFALVGIKNLQNKIGDYLENGVRLAYDASSRMDMTEDAITTIAALFTHSGDMAVSGSILAGEVHAANGATGTFNVVQVVDGIVISGS